MNNLSSQVQWKALLAVFKIKRIIAAWFSKARLDFEKKELYIRTKNVREYHTRAYSCRKEPETCSWLQEIANEDSVFYDIGANIGAYSLIAASLGMKVVAFEPSPENYATLHENTRMNALEAKITPVPFVLGSKNDSFTFPVPDYTSGATATFVTNDAHKVGTVLLGITLDNAIPLFNFSKPTAVKIDVDGGEVEVLLGAQKTLCEKTVLDLLVEVDANLHDEVQKIVSTYGFTEVSRHERGKGVQNIIFKRV